MVAAMNRSALYAGMHTLTSGSPVGPATMASSDIHVILPGATPPAPPRRSLRAAAVGDAGVVVVVAQGEHADAAARLARAVDAGADAVFAAGGGLVGPGAGSFAVRRNVLADLDITEDWPAVGYE